jgi:large-conductance mechanosensitive channel
MKKLGLILIAVIPILLYIFDLTPFITDERPSSISVAAFQVNGKNKYAVIEMTVHRRRTRNYYYYGPIHILNPETGKHSNIDIEGTLFKITYGYVWTKNEEKGLTLYDLNTGKVILTEENLTDLFPTIKGKGSTYSYTHSTIKIIYDDGHEEHFNENDIEQIKQSVPQKRLADFTKRWDIAASSGSRSNVLYKNHASKSDFLDLEFILNNENNDEDIGLRDESRQIITTTDGTKALIGFRKKLKGDYTFAMVDSTGSIVWEKPSSVFVKDEDSRHLIAEINDNLLVFQGDKISAYNLVSGQLLWETPTKGRGVIPGMVYFIFCAFCLIACAIILMIQRSDKKEREKEQQEEEEEKEDRKKLKKRRPD